MDDIMSYFPFFIPLLLIQLGLAVAALVHIIRHPNYRFGNRIFWIIIVLVVSVIGPVLYFALGRGEE